MKLAETVSIPSGVVSQTLGDEVVLLHLHTGVYWSLNATGAVIWQEVQANGSVQRAADVLCEKFEVSKTEARQAVQGLLQELAKEGLVELAS